MSQVPEIISLKILSVLFVCQLVMVALAMPPPEEEYYYDREFPREFAPWMMSPWTYSQVENPCQPVYTFKGNYLLPSQHKRNSELINSLLTLPKTMNDAGK
ncbi:Protein PDF [Sergentomyia squamirostris]